MRGSAPDFTPEFNCTVQSNGSVVAGAAPQKPTAGKGHRYDWAYGRRMATHNWRVYQCRKKEQEKKSKKIQNLTRYDLRLWGAKKRVPRPMGTNQSAGAKQRRIETNQEPPWCIAVYRTWSVRVCLIFRGYERRYACERLFAACAPRRATGNYR